MRRILYFRVAGRDVHLPRLIGAFILVAAFLMFVQSSTVMFTSWDQLKEIKLCLQQSELNSKRVEPTPGIFESCRALAKDSMGLHLFGGQKELNLKQFWGSLLAPIAGILFWLAVLFVGYFLYRTGNLVLPIEERIREVPDTPKVAWKKKK